MAYFLYNKSTKEEGNLNKTRKELIMDYKKLISAILGKFAGLCLVAFISKMTYNVIAYEFNLPTFSFLIHLGVIYVSRYIFHDKKINED